MLISTWLQSFRNRLQPGPRRSSRRSPDQAARSLEHLESRHLLAAPQLIDVQDEAGRVISEDSEINTSPTEFALNFNSSPDLDAGTVNTGTFSLERAGQDGAFDGNDVTIPLTFVGVGSQPNEVLLQLNQPLPSDLYRINISGAVANTSGEQFNSGNPDAFGFTIQLPPPSLVAVRPNVGEFLQEGETRHIAPNELTLQFNPGQVIDPLTINTSTVKVQRAGHDGTFGDGNEQYVNIGYVGIGDVPEEVVVRFAENLPDDDYRILLEGDGLDDLGNPVAPIGSLVGETLNNGADTEFLFSLDLGARIVAVDPQPVTRNADGTITQARDQIVLYLNDDDLPQAVAEDVQYYQLFFTNDTVSNLDDNDLDNNPLTPSQTINPQSVAYDNVANTVTLTFASDIHLLAGAGTYRLRVGTNEATPLPPVQTTFTTAQDPGDSFDSASTADLGDLAAGGNQGHVVTSAIEPQPFPFDFPGANDEPGHRDIEIESHLGGGPDGLDGTSQIDYNFQDVYGFDPQGNVLINTITEAQKQRAREVFEYYSVLAGIDFRETTDSGFIIATGDLRALDPTVPTGPGGVTGIAGGGVAIMDQAEIWDDAPGASWFQTALHEIGHLLGIGHASDLSPVTVLAGDGFGNTNPGAFNGFSEAVYPGDHDLVHVRHLHRPDSIDIDLYRFDLSEAGLFTAEVMAERLADASFLDSYLRLYRENADGSRELVAQNDDYFSEDSYLELQLNPGRYFIGVSSTGNDDYDPTIPGTGLGGTSQGEYDLRLNFRPNPTGNSLVDLDGTEFDGDSDGVAGGVYNFWFRSTAEADTLFVDKEAADKADVGRANDGSAASPFLEIDQALAAATAGQVVRIVGNGGADGDISTLADNTPYQIGRNFSNVPLEDGATLEVPKGVTVMIDAGAVIKLRNARIGVGSSTAGADRSASALQILGTPGNSVTFTSWLDETIGTDTTSTPTTATPGNWGGIVFRSDIDKAEGRFNYQNEGIFLNYVGQADIMFGGGNVIIDSVLQPVNPIHLTETQPTIVHNTIMHSVDSAISADPDSFEERTFHAPRFHEGEPLFTSDYQRIGPDIYWNTLVENSTNGLFVRVQTTAGSPIQKLTVPGRFDDTDIVHVIAQNLEIQGTPSGPILDETPPDVALVIVNAASSPGGNLATGSYNYRLVYVDRNGIESPPSSVTGTVTVSPGSNSVRLTGLPAAPPEYVGRRLYRSDNTGSGTYQLAAELGRSETVYVDLGATQVRVLDTTVTSRNRARLDARLSIDPGVVVKLEGSRIETEMGAQLIAEGLPGREIIFTSRLDDRYGAGGTFDTNDDGDLVSALNVFFEDNFESGQFDSAIWAGTTNAAIDGQGLAETSGSNSAHLTPGTLLQTNGLNLTGQPSLELQFSYQRTGGGATPNANLLVQYRNASGTWVTLQTIAASGPDMTNYQSSVLALPAGAIHFNSAFRIAFGTPGGNTGSAGDWFVDDVRVVESRVNNVPQPGDWGGLYVGHLGSASIDQALVTYGGGVIPVGNTFAGFNAVEIHQAQARITNTVFEDNATGNNGGGGRRLGLESNSAGTVFVRGAQPIILNNDFRNNSGPVITINANALNSDLVRDPGRSTGLAMANRSLVGNQGPLIDNNRLGGNSINGMVVRPATLTTQSVWDDTDIVHVLLNEILIPDFHTFGGLRLESSSTESLVVKLLGNNAGFTANGYPIDIDDRIGGSLQIIGQPGQPVVLTSLNDDMVGAGFDLRGFPLRDTNNDGPSVGSPSDWRSVRIDQFAHDRNLRVVVENEIAGVNSAESNNTINSSEVVGLLAKDVKSGDENLRLGFEIHGVIDSVNDQDIYTFEAEAGTHVWLDIDRTSIGFDSVIELLDANGNIVAQSDNMLDERNRDYPVYTDGTTNALPLDYSQFQTRDLYTLNTGDAGMRVTLPGAVGVRQPYFVRVRSSNLNASFTPVIEFSDNFESGAFDSSRWAQVNFAEIDGVGLNEPSGALAARLNTNPAGGDSIVSTNIDLASSPAARLSYSWQRTGGGDSPENGEDLVISYRNAGGSWIELERQTGAGPDMDGFRRSIINLPAGAMHANFAFRIQTASTGGGTTDDWFVDDVVVESIPDENNRPSLQNNGSLGDGLTAGVYQLQVRLGHIDEVPGSQVTHADVRYASTGIEVIGQPIHGLLTGEAEEAGATTVLPNVLNTDRAGISISGRLDLSGTDIDFYQFELAYDVTQAIAGDGDDEAHVPVTFDVDFADGFSRANSTIAIFNDQNQLILVGRDSNIADDQPKIVDGAGDSVADVDDISRGSVGKSDAFIGPVELISGTYTLAIFPNDLMPSVLNQYFVANPSATDIRLEPVNSTQRIAEERFDLPSFVFDPDTFTFIEVEASVTSATPPIVDLFERELFTGDLNPKHVVPFHLGDVNLFVSQSGATKPGDRTVVQMVDPFTGATETILGSFNLGIGDIAMRADGQLHAFSTLPPIGTGVTDGNVGNYLRIDTGTASIANIGDDGVATQILNGNAAAAHDVGIQYNAIAYSGTSAGNNLADVWAVGNRTQLGLKQGQQGIVAADYVTNILYNLNLASGGVDGNGQDRTGNNGFSARVGAGTPQREHGFIDTTFANGGLQGTVTGLVTLDDGFSFYAVDDAGGLYLVQRFGGGTSVDPNAPNGGPFFNQIRTTFIRNIGADTTGVGGLNLDFQGLALGPENVEGGLYAQTLFGITGNGDIYAFTTDGELSPVFVDGQTSVSTGLSGVNGLDFGTLDYNLWHVTSRRGSLNAADDGHGIDVPTFDNSVFLPEPGGSSLYFGFEGGGNTPDPSFGGNTRSGNKNTNANNSISNGVVNNLNFPGGAHGSVVSNSFSLEGYSSADKPVLYFNYWLETENTDFDPSTNPDILMKDAFRVFIQDEGGQWRLVTTNNSFQQDDELDEFDIGHDEVFSDGLSNNPSRQSFPDVVEAYDAADWRQARIDLSNYAGQSDLKLRFDFSTAGSMNLGDLSTVGVELYTVDGRELQDGDTFTLGDVDAFGFPTGVTRTFEFDLGAHLTVPSGNAAIGESFTVSGMGFTETFTFTDNPTGPNDVLALPSDSAAVLAERTNDFLNVFFGGNSIQLVAGDFLQNETFRYAGQVFTFTDTPVLPSDILAEPGDTASTIAARTAQVVNAVLGAGSAFPNGDIVDFFILGGGGVDFGGVMNVSNPVFLEGESFTVLGQTFTFTANPKLATDIDIATFGTAGLAAEQTVNVINSVIGAGTAIHDPLVSTRVTVPDLPTAADGFFTGGTLVLSDVQSPSDHQLESFTLFGKTYTFTDTPTEPLDILAEAGDTADVLAARVRAAIEAEEGPGVVLPFDPLAPERISVPRIDTIAEAFRRGGSLVVQNVPDLQGYEFELYGLTFRFTDNPTRPTDILARRTDAAAAVAAEAVRIINNNLGFGTAFQADDRVSIPDLSSAFAGIYHGSRLNFDQATPENMEGDSFTVFGTTYTFTRNPLFTSTGAVDIPFSSTTTADDFVTLAATAINNALAGDGLAPRATAVTSASGAGSLVGIDFGPAGDSSPSNWNSTDGNGGVDYSISNLRDEVGNPTPFDLDVFFSPGGTGGAVANTPDPLATPSHTNPLDNIDGALQHSLGTTFVFSDLTPGATYEIYVFGGDTATTGNQNVRVNGISTSIFPQNWANQQYVNSSVSSNAALSSFAIPVVANNFGNISVQVTEASSSDDVVIPALGIRQISNPAYVEIAGATSGIRGTTMYINGPTAAVTNGDTINVDGFLFSYVGNAPANQQEIQTNDNEIITATNTVDTLNTLFNNFGFTNWVNSFRTGTRVSIPSDPQVTYTDSGVDGSIYLSDHAQLVIRPGDDVAGDQLIYRGLTFTFTDTTTPAFNEIGSDGAGNWDGDDIAAAINRRFGAGEALNQGGVVTFYQNPGFFGPLLTYNDIGGTGLEILDDGSGDNPFFFTQISRPLNGLLLTDEIGSPLLVDQVGTTLFHDVADTPLTLVGGGPSVVNDNRITLRNVTSISTSGSTLITGGQAGSNFGGLQTILIDPTMTEADVALAVRQAIADAYSASDINNVKGHDDMVRVINRAVIDAGPLQAIEILPGDEFGAFSGFDAGYINSQAALRPGSVRGMFNDVEGVYIDDIVIGFAERGEMVTNAPAGTGFIQNPDVADDATTDKAEFNQFGEFNEYLDILSGAYDIEIRTAGHYGLSQTANPTNILYRTLDTNARESEGLALTLPPAVQIPDRSVFTVSNGIRSVNYQFIDTRGANNAPDPGHIAIFYEPIFGTDGTGDDSREDIARRVAIAINSAASQDALSPEHMTDQFGVQAVYSDSDDIVSQTGDSATLHLTGNATLIPDTNLAPLFQIEVFNGTGDRNQIREQGQIIIDSSFVTDSGSVGIRVDNGTRADGLAHPGSVRTTQEENPLRLVPGVVISNNVVARNRGGGILYSGDAGNNPSGVASVGRIVNNTVYGLGNATGISVNDGASPTLMNNIVANFGTGINVSGASAIIGSTLYQNNGTNSNAGLGTFPIVLGPTEQLFVDAASGNFYPAPASRAIDSSLQTLQDNPDIVRVKSPLGGGLSPLLAPSHDVFGQVRGDDAAVATPSGQGGNVFIDRGAIDRVDFFAPVAVLATPEDNGLADIDPDLSEVWVNLPSDLREFRIRLVDQGIGIDDTKVNKDQFTLSQDGVPLIEGVHYIWAYNSVNNDVIFTAVTSFEFERRYTITVENNPIDPGDPASIEGVQDLAGNFLAANRTDGTTQFQILVTDGVNDPPINTVPGLQTINEDATLVFSESAGNAIRVSDADVHLADNPRLNITISVTDGLLSLGGTTGLTFPTGDTGSNEASITFSGSVTDLNNALNGLTFVPTPEYFNLLPGQDPSTRTIPPVLITITTDDTGPNGRGQFTGPPNDAPEFTTDQIPVNVISVNDPPTFNPPADPPAIDEDNTAVQTIPNFVTGVVAGPPTESSQTVSFNVVAPVIQSGNLVFTQAPAISSAGELTYQVAGDTNGVATFTFTVVDADASDPNHIPATSDPHTVTITVNPINDEPTFTLNSNTHVSDEDDGPVGPVDLIASVAVGPAAATDEAASQTPTFRTTSPVVTGGNLVFSSFNVTAAGQLSYEALPNTAGTATFDIWVTDDGPTTHPLDDNTSPTQTITITVNAVADPPVPVTPDYVIDHGDSVTLDGSGSTDPDLAYAGTATELLSYSWDIGGDGTFEVTNDVNSQVTISAATLDSLGLSIPGDNVVVLRVTDTFSGTSVDTTATLTINTVDYGDAPDSYGTLKASSGAAHTFVDGFHLGSAIDTESDGQPVDLDGADEDGITFDPAMQADGTFALDSFFTATASAAGKLDIWIDYNNDGDFDSSEHLNGGVSFDVVAGTNTFNFTIPAGAAVTGVDTWARARLSSAGGLAPIGRAADGEVEDYQLVISPLLPAEPVNHILPMWPQTSDLTPLLQWEPDPGTPGANVSYNIELRNALGQVVGFEEDHTSTSIEVSDPLPPGVYTAYVTSFNRAGVAGPTTELTSFEVVAMTVTSPTGTLSNGFPTIEWTSVTQTDRYEVEIQSSLTGAVVHTNSNVPGTVTSYTPPNELSIGGYRVRVRAVEAVTGQVGDWSAFQLFDVGTSPVVTAPTGIIVDATPTITWEAVNGAATYDVRVSNITGNVLPLQTITGLTSLTYDFNQVLPLGEYTVEVRGVTAQNFSGDWSAPETFFVQIPSTVTRPIGAEPDSTPTITWTAVNGADNYDVEIVNSTTSQVVLNANGLTATQYTVPNAQALPLGNYEIRIRANNVPTTGSTGGTVSVLSAPAQFTVNTPPEILTPNVGIYDTTPTFTWTEPLGAQTAELQITNFVTDEVVFTQAGIVGTSFTIPDSQALPPGGYSARLRSVGDGGATSAWSTVHVFQIGAAPVALGPSEGVGSTPFTRTEALRPTLTAQQSLAGVTFEFWLTDVANGQTVTTVRGLDASSWTVPSNLAVGTYRYWVRATTDAGEQSAWSAPFVFEVVTPPAVASIQPTFNRRPPIRWNVDRSQPEIDRYQVWINRIDRIPAQVVLVEDNVTGTSFDLPEDLDRGRYKVWVRGYAEASRPGVATTVTSWSPGQVFEVGGRPIVTPIGDSIDNTPLVTWSQVDGAASYEIYLARQGAIGSPVIRQSGLTSTSFQVTNELAAGSYIVWIRSRSTGGEVSPWSLTAQGRFTVNAVTTPVLDPIPNGSNRRPTFNWSAATGAVRYELYVAPASNISSPVIQNNQITATQFTSNVALAPNTYRAWVRAINSGSSNGPWSSAVTFTVTANETQPRDDAPQVMLASLEAVSDELQAQDVTVTLVPATVVSDSGRVIRDGQQNIAFTPDEAAAATALPESTVEAADKVSEADADSVMSAWDDVIWAEESAAQDEAVVVADPSVSPTEKPEARSERSMLAGLALLAPSVFRRRRRKDR